MLPDPAGPRWEEPVSLDEPDLPAFFTEVLPGWVREWVEEEAREACVSGGVRGGGEVVIIGGEGGD